MRRAVARNPAAPDALPDCAQALTKGGVAMKRGLPLTLMLLLAACGRHDGTPGQPDTSSASQPQNARADPSAGDARVQLAPTQGNTANGSLVLSRSPEGVQITGAVQGLKPDSEFGFHVHEKGDCSAPDASSAGEHFNPTHQPHGNPAGAQHHTGDMANLRSDDQGVAQVDVTITEAALGAPQAGGGNDLMGKAIVVHEHADDYTTRGQLRQTHRVRCDCGGVCHPGLSDRKPLRPARDTGCRASGDAAAPQVRGKLRSIDFPLLASLQPPARPR
jgi:superoxide dismutase, Cu-Zn family